MAARTIQRMRLYLSSEGIGNRADDLRRLAGPNPHAAVIPNAADHRTGEIRDAKMAEAIRNLACCGITAELFDLVDYFGAGTQAARIGNDLSSFGLVWAPGGSAFVLRAAMARSGADIAIGRMVREGRICYGGWSAGSCVAGPSLEGVELMDSPADVASTYRAPVVWDGLGLLDSAVVPHAGSSRQGRAAAAMVEHYRQTYRPYVALADGEVLVLER